ncbi:hypothetical protein MRB53_008976 [Persea americana]|uniref:Uncharacterized protein n=1 Tax=Persea americana TaxID=3435 RepID=A0ACC2LNT7_PERAE|nr:hypothetical protein MRB53_008976 [Persea americana]
MKGKDDRTSAGWCHDDHSIYILSSEDQFIVSLSRVMGGVMVIMTQLDSRRLLDCVMAGRGWPGEDRCGERERRRKREESLRKGEMGLRGDRSVFRGDCLA